MIRTHTGLQQLVPLRFQIKHHPPPGSWQGGASNQEDEEHNVGQSGGHPHNLLEGNREVSRGGKTDLG